MRQCEEMREHRARSGVGGCSSFRSRGHEGWQVSREPDGVRKRAMWRFGRRGPGRGEVYGNPWDRNELRVFYKEERGWHDWDPVGKGEHGREDIAGLVSTRALAQVRNWGFVLRVTRSSWRVLSRILTCSHLHFTLLTLDIFERMALGTRRYS